LSTFRGGYLGRFLRVDLGTLKITVEETPKVSKWLGPRGWNAYIGWNEVGPGIGPFDPDNRLVLSAGPLVGTGAPTAGRTTASSLMPRGYPVPTWASGSMGGYFGAELKYAGYDGLVVQGRAHTPCYLLIEDDRVTLEDARDLWGKGVFQTQEVLKERHGRQVQVAAIGPAGEHLVRFASIIHRLSNAVGNAGFGGVMGAKRLKAIVVRGTGGVPIADPAGFLKTVEDVWRLVRGGFYHTGQLVQGYPLVACSHGCTVRCHTRMEASPAEFVPDARMRMLKCNNLGPKDGLHAPYDGTSVHGETLHVPRPAAFGEMGLDLGNLIDDMGLTAWCYNTWYRYLGTLRELGIREVLGEVVELDDPLWWRDWVLKVAHRQGNGNEFAEGVARFYDKHQIGPSHVAAFIESAGSRGHNWHREGRTLESQPSPTWEYAALLYAVSTRDMTPSTHGFFFLGGLSKIADQAEDPAKSERCIRRFAERIYGAEDAFFPGSRATAAVTAWHQHRSVIKDSMGVCDWVFPALRRTFETVEDLETAIRTDVSRIFGDPSAEARLYRACTGIDMDITEMERPVAERIVNLERCIDVRNTGRRREDDEAVIPHFQWPEKTDGTHLSADANEFRTMLEEYYALRGWEGTTGRPSKERLIALGLEQVAEVLYPCPCEETT